MKVLILSCRTGQGHNSAAAAVKEELERAGVCCEIDDPVRFQSARASRLVAGAYNELIKTKPRAFGGIYRVGKWYSSKNLPSPIYHANALYAGRLGSYIERCGFDAVVYTHLYGMEAMTALRRRRGADVRCYGVLTDYTCIPFLADTELDGYFVPHAELKDQLSAAGIPADRIVPTGIPVGCAFSEKADRSEARGRLNIPQNARVLLVMTGGVGCGDMAKLCDTARQADGGCELYVLTGSNARLREVLDSRYGGSFVHALPFTEKVRDYMAASDVLISKAGGLSSTEAAVANIPIVHLRPIPGCETENARFFERLGMSVWAKDEREAVDSALALVKDADAAEKMKKAQREGINPHAAREIARAVMQNAG